MYSEVKPWSRPPCRRPPGSTRAGQSELAAYRRELFKALSAGEAAEWEFSVQLFTQARADSFPFDPLDATKLIPEDLVPGIDFSNDPLLQGWLLSYLDTQLSRPGSPNFAQLPINAPQCPFAHQQCDGPLRPVDGGLAGRVSPPTNYSCRGPRDRAEQARLAPTHSRPGSSTRC